MKQLNLREKKIFDPLFIDIDLFYVPFIPPIRILVGGPSNQYGKKESSTRSILSKIGREFIRFLWGETCGWKERKISHFEEISFFNTGEEPNSSQKLMMENYIIGSEGAVGACG